MTKGFDHRRTALDFEAGHARLEAEGQRLAEMKAGATPPAAMHLVPIAPARGVQQLVPDWEVLPGGTRRQSGAHWITPSPLDIENHRARDRNGAAAADRAETRAERRGTLATDGEREQEVRRIETFTPSQVAMADRYRGLIEWRAGSAIKCAKLEGGAGGSDRGEFIDAFCDAGDELAALVLAIGMETVLSPRRHMDRDNARRPLTVRAAVDGVVLKGQTISKVISAHGWKADGRYRREVRDAIRGALDRMIASSGRLRQKGA